MNATELAAKVTGIKGAREALDYPDAHYLQIIHPFYELTAIWGFASQFLAPVTHDINNHYYRYNQPNHNEVYNSEKKVCRILDVFGNAVSVGTFILAVQLGIEESAALTSTLASKLAINTISNALLTRFTNPESKWGNYLDNRG